MNLSNVVATPQGECLNCSKMNAREPNRGLFHGPRESNAQSVILRGGCSLVVKCPAESSGANDEPLEISLSRP
jgi:hypothetical protein